MTAASAGSAPKSLQACCFLSFADPQDFTISEKLMPGPSLKGRDSQSTDTIEGISIDFNLSSAELFIFHVFLFHTIFDLPATCQPEQKP